MVFSNVIIDIFSVVYYYMFLMFVNLVELIIILRFNDWFIFVFMYCYNIFINIKRFYLFSFFIINIKLI